MALITRQQILRGLSVRMMEVRQRLDLNRSQMAEILGMSRNTLGKVESGAYFPNLPALHILSERYHVSMDWLIFNKGPSDLRKSQPLAGADAEPLEPGTQTQPTTLSAPQTPPEPNAHPDPDIRELLETMQEDKHIHHSILAYLQELIKKKE